MTSHAASSVGEVGGVDGVGDRDPAVLLEEGDVCVGRRRVGHGVPPRRRGSRAGRRAYRSQRVKSIPPGATARSTAGGRAGQPRRRRLRRPRRRVHARPRSPRSSTPASDLVADLVRDRQGHRLQAGSYVFDPDFTRLVIIKWEGDTDVVHGIEPCAHLSPALRRRGRTTRASSTPMQRPRRRRRTRCCSPRSSTSSGRSDGGVNPLHQDYPYWVDVADDPADVATAMLFLDDATLDNGCLRVVPGSHTTGVWDRRTDGDAFLGNEIDGDAYPGVESVPLEVRGRIGRDVRLVPRAPLGAEPLRRGRGARCCSATSRPAVRTCSNRCASSLADARSRRHDPAARDHDHPDVTTITDVARAATCRRRRCRAR